MRVLAQRPGAVTMEHFSRMWPGSSLLSKDGILPASAQELKTESSLLRVGTETISKAENKPIGFKGQSSVIVQTDESQQADLFQG